MPGGRIPGNFPQDYSEDSRTILELIFMYKEGSKSLYSQEWNDTYALIEAHDPCTVVPSSAPPILRIAGLIPRLLTLEIGVKDSDGIDPLDYLHRARVAFRSLMTHNPIPLPSLHVFDQPMSTADEDVLVDIYTLRLAMLLGLVEETDLPASFQRRVAQLLRQAVVEHRLSKLQSSIIVADRAQECFCTLLRENARRPEVVAPQPKKKPASKTAQLKGEHSSVGMRGKMRRRAHKELAEEPESESDKENKRAKVDVSGE